MPVRAEQATVYRGGGRRWLSLKTACKKEAQAIHRERFREDCYCERPEGNYDPGSTCHYHEEPFYTRFVRRVARIVERNALSEPTE